MFKALGGLVLATALVAGVADAQVSKQVKVGDPKVITDSDQNGPLHFREFGANFGDHRDSTVKSVFHANGQWLVRFIFSNGNRWDAEDFVSVIHFFDETGSEITEPLVVKSLVGATRGGKTKKDIQEYEGRMSSDQLDRFSYYTVTQFTTDRDLAKQIKEGTEVMKSLNEAAEQAVKLYALAQGS